MPIVAKFPAGVTEVTVNGLHQWDYGQQLQIESDDLPAVVEVHFAYAKIDEAIVRSCAVVNGVATVTIPDLCLEQTAQIIAWVFVIDEASGTTKKTIKMNVIARKMPESVPDIPEDFTDKYTEAITAFNKNAEALKSALNDGTVVAKEAKHALSADTASKATQADKATKADTASKATQADKAVQASKVVSNGLQSFQEPSFEVQQLPSAGYYCVSLISTGAADLQESVLLYWNGKNRLVSGVFGNLVTVSVVSANAVTTVYNQLVVGSDGTLEVKQVSTGNNQEIKDVTNDYTIYAIKIWG